MSDSERGGGNRVAMMAEELIGRGRQAGSAGYVSGAEEMAGKPLLWAGP